LGLLLLRWFRKTKPKLSILNCLNGALVMRLFCIGAHEFGKLDSGLMQIGFCSICTSKTKSINKCLKKKLYPSDTVNFLRRPWRLPS
jgi:hypothetical protein